MRPKRPGVDISSRSWCDRKKNKPEQGFCAASGKNLSTMAVSRRRGFPGSRPGRASIGVFSGDLKAGLRSLWGKVARRSGDPWRVAFGPSVLEMHPTTGSRRRSTALARALAAREIGGPDFAHAGGCPAASSPGAQGATLTLRGPGRRRRRCCSVKRRAGRQEAFALHWRGVWLGRGSSGRVLSATGRHICRGSARLAGRTATIAVHLESLRHPDLDR